MKFLTWVSIQFILSVIRMKNYPATRLKISICYLCHYCADVATVHPDAGQPVYRDAPGHIS